MGVDEIVSGIEDTLADSGDISWGMFRGGTNTIASITSMILGWVVVIILILFPIIIALEIMYITFPILQETITAFKDKSHRGTGFTQSVVKFAFGDAVKAMERSTAENKSPYTVYISIKIKWILIVAVALVLMMYGPGYMMNVVYNVFRGILDPLINQFG